MNADKIFYGFCAIVVALLVLLTYIAVTTPSCEERGGTSKFSHFQPIYTGKVMIMSPIYDCIMEE